MIKYKLLKDEENNIFGALIQDGEGLGTSFLFIDDTPCYEAYKLWVAEGNTADPAD